MRVRNKEKEAAWRKKRHDKLKAKALAHLGGVCVVCGTTEKLQFDHIDPATKCFNIVPGLRYSWDRVLVEINKCQLLCRPHHDDKTARDRGHSRERHGTPSAYQNYKCRCDDCRAAWNEYMRPKLRAYRAKKAAHAKL